MVKGFLHTFGASPACDRSCGARTLSGPAGGPMPFTFSENDLPGDRRLFIVVETQRAMQSAADPAALWAAGFQPASYWLLVQFLRAGMPALHSALLVVKGFCGEEFYTR